MNKLVKKLMLVAAMLMLAAGPSFAADAIRIGLMCPLTGKWASEGQDMQQIVSLLVSEVNKAGGINGKQIELIVEDDAGDPRTASLAAQKLASAGVMAVIGTYGSAVTEASQNIIDEAEIMQIATGSTSVRLTEKGLPLFFRTCPAMTNRAAWPARSLPPRASRRSPSCTTIPPTPRASPKKRRRASRTRACLWCSTTP